MTHDKALLQLEEKQKCLYDSTTTQLRIRKKTICLYDNTTTQLRVTCSNIFTWLHMMAFINYHDRLSIGQGQFLKEKFVPM